MINLLNIICILITLNGCSVHNKDDLNIELYNDEINLDDILPLNTEYEENKLLNNKNYHTAIDNKKQIKNINNEQSHTNNNDQILIEKQSFKNQIEYISEHTMNNISSTDNNKISITTSLSNEQDSFNEHKIKLKNNLNAKQKDALKFLEKALRNKIDKLNKILLINEDEIKNILNIISENLKCIKNLESVNELILDFENPNDNNDKIASQQNVNDEEKVTFTNVKNDLNSNIEPSLDDYLSIIDAHFNDDNMTSSINGINSIKILSIYP